LQEYKITNKIYGFLSLDPCFFHQENSFLESGGRFSARFAFYLVYTKRKKTTTKTHKNKNKRNLENKSHPLVGISFSPLLSGVLARRLARYKRLVVEQSEPIPFSSSIVLELNGVDGGHNAVFAFSFHVSGS